jgi:hypothetical protein
MNPGALLVGEDPIAIVFLLVHPSRSVKWLRDERGEHRANAEWNLPFSVRASFHFNRAVRGHEVIVICAGVVPGLQTYDTLFAWTRRQ